MKNTGMLMWREKERDKLKEKNQKRGEEKKGNILSEKIKNYINTCINISIYTLRDVYISLWTTSHNNKIIKYMYDHPNPKKKIIKMMERISEDFSFKFNICVQNHIILSLNSKHFEEDKMVCSIFMLDQSTMSHVYILMQELLQQRISLERAQTKPHENSFLFLSQIDCLSLSVHNEKRIRRRVMSRVEG